MSQPSPNVLVGIGALINNNHTIHRKRKKDLGILELVAIALGGMVGGGIFTILGVSVSMVGVYTPVAIILGGGIASLAAYSYVKLGVYYRDEGATYSFFKRTYPHSSRAASLIGWWVVFGYICTLALYAYTFAAYAISGTSFADSDLMRKVVAGLCIAIFALINIWSVKGMGKLEDLLVYSKLLILVMISFVLVYNSNASVPQLLEANGPFPFMGILIVASVTFVAYEGFQLVIHAVDEMDDPARNIPRAIYTAIGVAITIYIVIALGAIVAIPFDDIIANKEYALASGAGKVLGHWGNDLVVFGALLATSSAISGTLFGASRLMAIIAGDGYFPKPLAKRENRIPTRAIITMSVAAMFLVASGGLQLILKFGSITFLLVSFLMAIANHKMRRETHSSSFLTVAAMIVLASATLLIVYYVATTEIDQLVFIICLYALVSGASWLYAKTGAAL